MEAPDFWDNAEVSQKKMKELKSMKDDMETYQNLVTQKEDMETLDVYKRQAFTEL